MGQRSRRRDRAPTPQTPSRSAPSRSARRDEQTRAELEPLATGERPIAVVIAAVIAGLSGVANLVAYAAGLKIRGHAEAAGGVIAFSVIMLIAAVGMFALRYWAVLGFQALLALTILAFGINLIKVSTILGLLISLTVVGLGGLLFWKLVKALARIQMPERR